MKPLWQLHTNEGVFYVRATHVELRNWMFLYLKLKQKKGVGLSQVLFSWTPIFTTPLKEIVK